MLAICVIHLPFVVLGRLTRRRIFREWWKPAFFGASTRKGKLSEETTRPSLQNSFSTFIEKCEFSAKIWIHWKNSGFSAWFGIQLQSVEPSEFELSEFVFLRNSRSVWFTKVLQGYKWKTQLAPIYTSLWWLVLQTVEGRSLFSHTHTPCFDPFHVCFDFVFRWPFDWIIPKCCANCWKWLIKIDWKLLSHSGVA